MNAGGDLNGIRLLCPFGGVVAYGSERANLRILSALQSRGAVVRLIYRSDADETLNRIVKQIDAEPLIGHWGVLIGKNILNPLEAFIALRDFFRTLFIVRKAIQTFHPTHIYCGNLHCYLFSCVPIILSGIPLIYRCGDRILGRHWQWIFKTLLLPGVRRIICISRFIQNDLIKLGTPSEKLIVTYNHPPPAGEERAGDPAIVPGGFRYVISYLGQISAHKGVHLFIEAASDIARLRDDVVFLAAGNYLWPKGYGESLIARVKSGGLGKRIVFPGFLDHPEKLLDRTDILCVPSICGEPLGNVVLEAKAAGVPAVVFPDGGLPEMIEHGVDGYVCRDKTPDALKEGILFFLEVEERLVSAKKKAKDSLCRFDRDNITDEWLSTLKAVSDFR